MTNKLELLKVHPTLQYSSVVKVQRENLFNQILVFDTPIRCNKKTRRPEMNREGGFWDQKGF